MAYAGTTSTSPNAPRIISQGITGLRQWLYVSTHVSSDVNGTAFFSDGKVLGMKVGDPVLVVGSTTYLISSHAVIVSTTTGAHLSTGSLYSS